jgi:uncharacterized protein (TIGR02444 family)
VSAAAFWTWSLARYDAKGVSARLLALQDEFDLDVNILLWCGWCAERYGDIPDSVLKTATDLCGRWSREVTAPLRAVRRALKSPPPEAAGAASARLRLAVKDAELNAEEVEQAMLETLAEELLRPADDAGNSLARLERNLVNYAIIAGVKRRAGFSALALAELAQSLLPGIARDEEEQSVS